MTDDVFSELSKKVTGLDITLVIIGLFWAVGTVMAFEKVGVGAFATVIPIWGGFAGYYYLIRRANIKSSWKSILLSIIVLQLWKSFVVVAISMIVS